MTATITPVDERVVWATEITRLPRDPSVTFGGTIVLERGLIKPSYVSVMPPHQRPIQQKRDDEQTAILKKILQGLQTRAPQSATGVQSQITGTQTNPRIHKF